MLEVRRTRFDWTQTPLAWIPGDPHSAKVIDVLHLLLPKGERWFCRVLHDALPHVRDAALREDIEGFLRQEAWHARAHDLVGDHLADHGVEIESYTKYLDSLFDVILADRNWGRWWLGFRLSLVGGLEHYTANLGHWALNAGALDAAGADPVMLDLLRWHSAEEVEHRAVTHDTAQALGVSYPTRVLAFAFVVPVFWYAWGKGAGYLARRDPASPPANWRDFFRGGREGKLPTLGYLARATLRYFSPRYHPRREGDLAQAQAYLAVSPAARAARVAA
ncbi:MAG TPA: metal-dependent hydrolase [Kofleriaceae bacterium]|jgi:hypothetical protein